VPTYLTPWAWAEHWTPTDIGVTCIACGALFVAALLDDVRRCPKCGYSAQPRQWESADILGQLRTPKPPEGQ